MNYLLLTLEKPKFFRKIHIENRNFSARKPKFFRKIHIENRNFSAITEKCYDFRFFIPIFVHMNKEPQSLADVFAQFKDADSIYKDAKFISSLLSETEETQLVERVKDVIQKSPTSNVLPEVYPKTVKETMSILQPKTITYASYNLTAVQEDMLTYITEQLQEFASSKSSLIRPNLFGNLSIELNVDNFPTLRRNWKKFLEQIDDLRRKDFAFSWNCHFANTPEAKSMFAKDGVDSDIVEVETKGSIITTLHYIKSQSRVILDINPWSIPYLLYYGPKVGGTKYYKEIALSLPGKYSKRVYKMIMDWLTLGDYHEESIAAFRYCLQIPESYDNNKIKTEILDRAKKEIDESGSHIKFDYEFITRKSSTSKTKRAYDTIAFTIKGHSIRKNSRQTNAEIMLMMLVDIADKNRKALCQECVQKIVSDSKFNHIMSKFSYYRKQVQDRKLSKEAYKSTMLKIILEETGFELRSAEHVKNSDRFKRKHNLSGKK